MDFLLLDEEDYKSFLEVMNMAGRFWVRDLYGERFRARLNCSVKRSDGAWVASCDRRGRRWEEPANADSWIRPFDASYDFVRVSRETGLELDFVRDIENGGSIERNANTALYETASLDFADKFDVGNDFLRVYLNATFTDGSKRRECLGTFMPQVDSVDIDGAYREGQINAYGLLKRLKDDDFDGPYVIVAGSNLVDEAVKIAESVGLTVYADPSSLLLGSTLVFGVGGDNDAKNKLDAVDLLLKAAGFRSPVTDRMGNVIYRRYVEPADMPISAEFTEGRDARFMPAMTESTNRAEVCNVVHVDFSTQDASVRGTAVDDSPDSDLSTVSVGRRIVKSYSYDSLPGVDTEDANLVEAPPTPSSAPARSRIRASGRASRTAASRPSTSPTRRRWACFSASRSSRVAGASASARTRGRASRRIRTTRRACGSRALRARRASYSLSGIRRGRLAR